MVLSSIVLSIVLAHTFQTQVVITAGDVHQNDKPKLPLIDKWEPPSQVEIAQGRKKRNAG